MQIKFSLDREKYQHCFYTPDSYEIQLNDSKVILLFRIQFLVEYEYIVLPKKNKWRIQFIQVLELKNENENISLIRKQLKQYLNSKKFWKEQFPKHDFKIAFKVD